WVGLLLATPFLLMLIFYVIYPFIRLVQTALGDPGGWSNVTFFFSNTANVFVVQITFRDAAIVTLIDVVAGGVMAWALRSARTRPPRRGSAPRRAGHLRHAGHQLRARSRLLPHAGAAWRLDLTLHRDPHPAGPVCLLGLRRRLHRRAHAAGRRHRLGDAGLLP